MSQNDNDIKTSRSLSPSLVLSADEYFIQNLSEGFNKRKVKVMPEVLVYLSKLLNHFMLTQNFHEEEFNELGQRNPRTLAELLLVAQSSESTQKQELLRKLGDRTLYISGFFADSLNRSLVDLDYYKNMGITAYTTLSYIVKDGPAAKVYSHISTKFTEIADVLTVISHQSVNTSDQNILRLYESYLKTGSNLAKEKLSNLGVIAVSDKKNKKINEH